MTREEIKHDWSVDEVMALFEAPLNDLLFQAQSIHRRYHTPNEVQISTLFSIKTGRCPEDCKFCPQSIHYDTGLDLHNLRGVDDVVEAARKARAAGATRNRCPPTIWFGWRERRCRTPAMRLSFTKAPLEYEDILWPGQRVPRPKAVRRRGKKAVAA